MQVGSRVGVWLAWVGRLFLLFEVSGSDDVEGEVNDGCAVVVVCWGLVSCWMC